MTLARFSGFNKELKFNRTNGGREEWMPAVIIREGESFESALKRFKKQCEKTGILSEIKKREHYEKPSVKRKKKILAAKKRALKKLKRTMDKGLY